MRHEDFVETNLIWAFDTTGVHPVYKEHDLNHMLAGDTDSAYMFIPESFTDGASNDEIVEKCDEIGGNIDKTFPDFTKSVFNCPDDRLDTIKTDREAVSDKSLFLTKKRYIMHVINMEGDPCDKLKIMGVELKKSDVSVATKTILRELVDAILDGNSMRTVLDMVTMMKRDFSTRFSPHDIAKPSSCKTLKAAQEIYRETGSMKGFHYTARAAMFYNKICTKSDHRINPGDKIKIIYIKHPDSKYIAFPSEAEELPDWFGDYVIDYDTEWKKTFKKVNNYLTAIGWDLESRRKEKRQELLGF